MRGFRTCGGAGKCATTNTRRGSFSSIRFSIWRNSEFFVHCPSFENDYSVAFYENILTIQDAADLEWPATDPANAGVRGEFLIGIFPPDHGGNHAPPTPPAPQNLK
jgi:hypothetical protein